MPVESKAKSQHLKGNPLLTATYYSAVPQSTEYKHRYSRRTKYSLTWFSVVISKGSSTVALLNPVMCISYHTLWYQYTYLYMKILCFQWYRMYVRKGKTISCFDDQ